MFVLIDNNARPSVRGHNVKSLRHRQRIKTNDSFSERLVDAVVNVKGGTLMLMISLYTDVSEASALHRE